MADVDGDGAPDALWIGDQDLARLYRNDGDGDLVDASGSLPALTTAPRSVTLGDVDGDGDPDALVGQTFVAGTDRLWVNDGAGGFLDLAGALPFTAGNSEDFELLDANGDGDVDLLVAKGSQPDALLLGDGSGGFANVSNLLPSFPTGTFGLALGDLDGDGDLDAYGAVFSASQTDRLYLSGPGGVVGVTNQLPPAKELTRAVELGDVDGDGDLDAVLQTTSGFDAHVYLNDGAATFTNADVLLPPLADQDGQDLALGDLDLDGDLDAVLAFGLGSGPDAADPNVLLRNDGGVFAVDPAYPQLDQETRALALADLDRDGDLDVLEANTSTQDRAWRNLRTQLAWAAVPGLGKPLDLELFAGAGSNALLASAPATGELAVAGIENALLLDLAGLVVLGNVGLDPDGEGSFSLPVPADAALAGVTVFTQALHTAPLAFSNLEGVTLSTF